MVSRLAAERAEAYRRYNEALTALDRAIQALPELPAPPPPYDEQQLPVINEALRSIPAGQPARSSWWHKTIVDSTWRVIGPMFERQAAFNAALVDHLNLVLASGSLTSATRTRITTALNALPTATSAIDRVRAAVLLVITSPGAAIQK